MKKSQQPIRLYRSYSADNAAAQLGGFWTRTKPTGPFQSVLDSSILPSYKNTATAWIEIEVPAGTLYYEGFAAPQGILDLSGNVTGSLLGGGNQVFLDATISEKWVRRVGTFR